MKLTEVKFLLNQLSHAFQNSKGYQGEGVAESWHMLGLDDLPVDAVLMVVKTSIRDGRWTYPPSLPDIVKAYNDSLPKTTPMTFESLSERSWFKHAIIRMVKKRHPGYAKTHQFGSEEEMQKSLHILNQQRRKLEAELFEKYLPEVTRLNKQGLPAHKVIEMTFGRDYVPPHLRGEPTLLENMSKDLAKKLPGGA